MSGAIYKIIGAFVLFFTVVLKILTSLFNLPSPIIPTPRPTEPVSTSVATTTRPTTTAPTTTRPTTTAPVATRPGISVKNTLILFGSSKNEVINKLGAPSDSASEPLKSGGIVENLIYAEDYCELAIYQFLNGSFAGFYSCSDSYALAADGNIISPFADEYETSGKTAIQLYRDSQNKDKIYAYWIKYGEFPYGSFDVSELSGQEKLIFHATNGLRAVNGSSPLKNSETAAACARAHCADMAERNYFDHTSPDGETFADRIKKAGIAYSRCGENIAAGYRSAFDFVDAWYNSPGHKENMLVAEYEYLGVGMAAGIGSSEYGVYAAQDFYALRRI